MILNLGPCLNQAHTVKSWALLITWEEKMVCFLGCLEE